MRPLNLLIELVTTTAVAGTNKIKIGDKLIMIIKLNETMEHKNDITVDQLDPATNEVTIYWSEDGVEDKTIIFKQTFKKAADHEITGAWYATSYQELVGWHAGGADSDTEHFIGI